MVMEINASEMRRVQLFEVIGRVDSNNANELGAALDKTVDEGSSNLVLDLGGVEYMSSAGLREMVRVLKRVKRSGGDLRIASPSDRVKEVLELAGLDTDFRNLSDSGGSCGQLLVLPPPPCLGLHPSLTPRIVMPDQARLVISARLQDVRNACDFVVEAADQRRPGRARRLSLSDGRGRSPDQHHRARVRVPRRGHPSRSPARPTTESFRSSSCDTSPAFNPLDHEAPDPAEPLDSREPGGWGIYFIRRLMDDVTLRAQATTATCLTLVKNLPDGPYRPRRSPTDESVPRPFPADRAGGDHPAGRPARQQQPATCSKKRWQRSWAQGSTGCSWIWLMWNILPAAA